MNLEYFPQFVRFNYPRFATTISNSDLQELGILFKQYLEEKFIGKEDKLSDIWDIEPKTVVMNQVNKNPLTVNGYHPALILHFHEFCSKLSKEETQQGDK